MRAFHALCAVFALIASAGASTPRLDDITEYFRTSLSPRQGAPTVVNALAQTSDGYLWVATPTGLYRFDGVRFDRIDSVGTVRLLGEGIAALVATRSGRGLWIGYEYGGASFIEGDTLRNYPLESGLPRGTVKGLAVGTDGTVWAGTSRGLARFDGQRWADVTDALGLPSPYIEQVLADKTGNLWILARDKVALLRPGSPHVHVYAIQGDNVFQEDPAGRVWTMQTNPACLYLLDPTRDDAPACRPLPRDSFALWLVDQSGNLWVSDTAEHMRVLPIPSERSAPTAQSTIPPAATRPFVTFSSGEPNRVFQDREGNVWLGTPVGLEQMRVSRLRSHGPYAKIVVLGSGNHNSLWVGTTNADRPPGQDFFQLDRGVMVPYAGGPTMITATYRDPTGVLWVGGFGRLWKLEDREWEEIPAPPELSKALLTARVRTQSIARDTSGALWLSVAQAGLFRLEAGQWQRVLVPGIPPSEYPSVIHADANGPVWLGYPHARIAQRRARTSRKRLPVPHRP